MTTFSIILPSLRQKLCEECVDRINRYTQGIDYEIIVVSPFKPGGENIVWLPEKKPEGTVNAHAEAYKLARGKFIVGMSDDFLVSPYWLLGVEEFIDDKEKKYFPFAMGLYVSNDPHFGTVYGLYYPYFPVVSQKSLSVIGGWYSPVFIAHYADPDLGMRVWDAGGRCEIKLDSCIKINERSKWARESKHKHTDMERDFALFKTLWGHKYGNRFWPTMSDVNFNYPIPLLEEGNTFQSRKNPRCYAGQLEIYKPGLKHIILSAIKRKIIRTMSILQ